MHFLVSYLSFLISLFSARLSWSCESEFHGFGVHLGSVVHFNKTSDTTIQNVLDLLYHDLKIRHFRTSYEPYFSTSPGQCDLTCHSQTCTWAWESILKVLSNSTRYPNPTLMASVWSPPYYMKDRFRRLRRIYERAFYYYLKNVTTLIYQKYGLTVDHISPVNEPENIFALWDHCFMLPDQLCRMVAQFNDPIISFCPENSYFWVTKLYLRYSGFFTRTDCLKSCKIIATHAYKLNWHLTAENFRLATYDLRPYEKPYRYGNQPIWMTEVSSTNYNAELYQMQEGLDFALNIVNFLGVTCVERYYFWLAYTNLASGESLIWGDGTGGLYFPKKYFIYQHFTTASSDSLQNGPVKITSCLDQEYNATSEIPVHCIKFNSNTIVFVNRINLEVQLAEHTDCSCSLCCTVEELNIFCGFSSTELPARSVCTCIGGCR